MNNAKQKILLVEDDFNLGLLLQEFLITSGFRVVLSRDGEDAWSIFEREKFNICLLDVMLPKTDGFTLAKRIRFKNKNVPILFLTAKTLKEDKLNGFQIGADDYITKPFDEDELLCRINVFLKRNNSFKIPENSPTSFQIGNSAYDYKRQEITIQGKINRITKKENEILRLLCLHKNQILRRDEALELVYGENDYFLGRSFDVFITKLRKILRKDPAISIENIFGVGFMLSDE